MTSSESFAVLLDGGFVIKKLSRTLGRFPTAEDIENQCTTMQQHPALAGMRLLRIYFYHAPPATGMLVNPLDKSSTDLSKTPVFKRHESLLDTLELKPNFALRAGEAVVHNWKIGDFAYKSMIKNQRVLQPKDLVPNITQKGVDLRIGLDIARLSLRQLVSTIVVVTGDSDLIPAFKFARREGLRIVLDTMGHSIRRDLKAHADITI